MATSKNKKKLRAPKVSDSELSRVITDIYDELNKLSINPLASVPQSVRVINNSSQSNDYDYWTLTVGVNSQDISSNDVLTVTAGTGINLSLTGSSLEISASGSGSGDITSVNTQTNSGLSGGDTSGDVDLSLDINNLATATTSDLQDSIAILDGSTTKKILLDNLPFIDDYTVTESDVTAHQAALSITESQISDLQTYLTAHPTIGGNAANQNNSGNSFIQDLTFDTNGHVTAVASATASFTDTNYFLNGANWATGTGVLTLNVQGSSNVTVNLDGRYLTSLPTHNHDNLYYTESEVDGFLSGKDNYQSWTISDSVAPTPNTEAITSGSTLKFAGSGATNVTYSASNNTMTISSTDTNTDTNSFVSAGSYDASTKDLTLTISGQTDPVIDLTDIDADKLDGQDGSHYLNYNNLNNLPSLNFDNYDHWTLTVGTDSSDISSNDAVTLVAGTNVTLNKTGTSVTINSSLPSGAIDTITTNSTSGLSSNESSGNVTLNLALGNLTAATTTDSLDSIAILEGSTTKKITLGSVPISALNDDSTFLKDADFSTNGFLKRTGNGVYSVDTSTYLTSVSSSDVTQHIVIGNPAQASGGGALAFTNGEFIFTPAAIPTGFITEVNTSSTSGLSGGATSGSVNLSLSATSLTLENTLSGSDVFIIGQASATKKISVGDIDLSLLDNNTSGFIDDYTVTESDVTQHQSALAIAESQITFSSSFIEASDLSLVQQSANGGGSLQLSGTTFTFRPAAVSSFITLSDLSVGGNAPASGSGGLAYNNTNGAFTYTPPDLSSFLTSLPSHNHNDLYYTETEVNSLLSNKDNYDHWTISDGSNSGDIDSGATLTVAAGTGITTTYSSSTQTLTIESTLAGGDITAVNTATGSGLSGGASTGAANLQISILNLTDMTADVVGGDDELIIRDASETGNQTRRKAISEIKLSQFNNDAGFVTTTGSNTFVTSASFNTSNNGVLTLTRNDSNTVTVDLDGRYLPLGGGTLTGTLTVQAVVAQSNTQPKYQLIETDTTNENKEILVSGGDFFVRNLDDNGTVPSGEDILKISHEGVVTLLAQGTTSAENLNALFQDGNGVLKRRTLGSNAFDNTSYLPLTGGTLTGSLEVTDGNSAVSLQEYSNGAAIFLDGSNGDFTGGDYFHIIADGVGYLGLGGYGGGATPLNVNFMGNVGVGTNSPSKKLDVSGEIRASSGILFGTDTAAANTLDDYEEGTFTPTIHAGASNIVAHSNNYGKYTKIGNIVHCSGRFQTTSLTPGSSSTNVELGGLPFTASTPLSSGTGAIAGSIGLASGFSGEKPTTMQIRDNETNAFLYYQNSSLGFSNLKGNDFSSGANTIVFQITYHVA